MSELRFLETEIQMPLMRLPVRTVVASFEQTTLIISPGSKLSKDQLKSAGHVTDIVAPSLFHAGGLENAVKVHPQARVWVSPFRDPWPFKEHLPMALLAGMPKVNEVVFFHPKSKSLIVSDLCFNLVDAKGFGAWTILHLFGTYKKLGVSRFFTKFIQDKKAFEKSITEIFRYDFENIILSHGQNVIGGAKDRLRKALLERGFRI